MRVNCLQNIMSSLAIHLRQSPLILIKLHAFVETTVFYDHHSSLAFTWMLSFIKIEIACFVSTGLCPGGIHVHIIVSG